MTEQETIYQSIVQPSRNSATPVNWPSISGNPVNEFTTEGYTSCAFPTLFPTGSADFVSPHQCSVTIGNYFKHLMLYSDSRFAKHPRFRYHFAHMHVVTGMFHHSFFFRYFALNTEMRHRALQTGRIYVRQNPHDCMV